MQPVLRESVRIDRRIVLRSATGGSTDDWEQHLTTRATVLYLRGSETVISGRLQGRQSAVFTIRKGVIADAISTDMRLTDLRTSVVYNIRSRVQTDDRLFWELTCESGVAV